MSLSANRLSRASKARLHARCSSYNFGWTMGGDRLSAIHATSTADPGDLHIAAPPHLLTTSPVSKRTCC